jgi:hypothetical protein
VVVVQANTYTPGSLVNMPNGADIGSDTQNGNLTKGQLDEIRVYSRALTAAEIVELAK